MSLYTLWWFMDLHLSNHIDSSQEAGLRIQFFFFTVRKKPDLHSLILQLKAKLTNCNATEHAELKLISGF